MFWLELLSQLELKTQYVLLFEDDIAFCPGLVEFIDKASIGATNFKVVAVKEPNFVWLGRGFLGTLVKVLPVHPKVSFLPRLLELMRLNPGQPADLFLWSRFAVPEDDAHCARSNLVFHPKVSAADARHPSRPKAMPTM